MKRVSPSGYLTNSPCLVVALRTALSPSRPVGQPVLKNGAYATLASANKWIRENVVVKKRTNYKRGERPKLKDLHLDGLAIVCVLGHYIFLDHETYYSFFENEEDDVVTVWELEEEDE